MWPFAPRSIVDADTARWLLDNMAWLEGEFGEAAGQPRARLVLPQPGFFRSDGETGHALALRIFAQVKEYCGMEDWAISVVADDNPHARPVERSLLAVAPQPHTLGETQMTETGVEITYAAALVERPETMIAIFAHELGNCLLASAATQPPCDDEERGYLSNLTVVFLGFGVFAANARFQFDQYQDGMMQGWNWSRLGYLPENDLVHALALYLRLARADAGPAAACLKPHLGKLLHRALRSLPPDGPDVMRLRAAISPSPG
jgi:hypothetical protein